jgi:hypothetical protein
MTTLELEVVDLRTRVEQLETTVRQLAGKRRRAKPATLRGPMNQEQLLAWLKAEGLIIEPPPIVREYAAQWEALSEEEKQAVRWELDHLPPGPMVSDIIIENRR